jgi:hypothetical protein
MDDDGHIHEISLSVTILVQGGEASRGAGYRRFFLLQNVGQEELCRATHVQEVDDPISVHVPMIWSALSRGSSPNGEEQEKREIENLHTGSVPKPRVLVMWS